jgi:hypothetical protein
VAAYEVEQRTKFEEYWSRLAGENSSLQTAMERMTRQYVERMNRNLTEVQQEKESFQRWQTAMQHEVLQISEAVTLCAQPAVMNRRTSRRLVVDRVWWRSRRKIERLIARCWIGDFLRGAVLACLEVFSRKFGYRGDWCVRYLMGL